MATHRHTRAGATALVLGALGLGVAACGGASPAGQLRFHNQAPIRVVNDRKNLDKKPDEAVFYKALYHFDGFWHKRIDRWMKMPRVQRAQSVNSLDEVPDSTWFTNRIGARDLSLDEIRSGPNQTGTPEDHKPWVIKSSKVGGVTVGFVIVDQRGVKYVLKFDDPVGPEMETAADVVLQRLLWACGFNVPEDYIVHFRREDLVRAPDASIKDPMGNETPMTEKFIDMQLAKINVGKDGSIRGLVSQFIPGVPIGGYKRDGVREDDPNDTIPHQLRRETRGLYAINSWLDHTDMKEDNTLDTYIEDPRNPDVHYVDHYLIDFGKGLGTQGYLNQRRWVGFTYLVDFGQMAASLFTLGLYHRPWEGRTSPDILGVGILESEKYDPSSWKTYTPSYFPFHDHDRFDGFWGAKILIRFTREQIRLAVEQGQFSDPRAVPYLTETLIQRQRKTARYWFALVNPLDRFEVSRGDRGARLCFEDLTVRYKLDGEPTHYSARAFDYDGQALDWTGRAVPGPDGRACVEGVRPAASHDGYTVIELRTERRGADLPPTLIHIAAERRGGGRLRVIGLRRL
ncbi:MAG TPA: hypothetical protein VK698_06640 [Kofleriaceae bacterium]|nr:hypothetical protein [Kofleriaceae bacterium]